ncbi:hypothetical protein H6P81_013932 [Aristolochia fimbriata]|uniref:Ycf15 n=1 Tax=Aristolochia fimbriata TaxID=158543 RepID=A0AAV7EHP1_ARIFI|nr:hypothetical protein H6P81_013932 [Aristolochia fimbriata]
MDEKLPFGGIFERSTPAFTLPTKRSRRPSSRFGLCVINTFKDHVTSHGTWTHDVDGGPEPRHPNRLSSLQQRMDDPTLVLSKK